MWDVRRFVRLEEFPRGRRVVIHFLSPTRAPASGTGGWSSRRAAPTCAGTTPGHDLTLVVESRSARSPRSGPATATHEEALRSKEIRVVGASQDSEALWRWLGTSAFAPTRRAVLQGT